MSVREYYLRSFWKTLPLRSYAILLTAIFFTFSIVGYLTDLWGGCNQSIESLAFNVVLSGLLGVAYGHGAMRDWRFLILAAAAQIALFTLIPSGTATIPGEQAVGVRHGAVIAGVLVSMIVGYVLFIVFIAREGTRHVALRTEVKLARQVHDVLVPDIDHRDRRFEVFGVSRPASDVGGDLLDLYIDRRFVTCYVADIAGHGIVANLLMGMVKSATRTRLQRDSSLTDLLGDVNRALHPLRKPGMFVTMAALRFGDGRGVEYTVAGHLPVLLYRAATGRVEELTVRQIALGVQPDYEFGTGTAEYEPGDCFVLLTDGITETSTPGGEQLGMARVTEILAARGTQSARDIHETILQEAGSFGAQRDDRTLMVIKTTG